MASLPHLCSNQLPYPGQPGEQMGRAVWVAVLCALGRLWGSHVTCLCSVSFRLSSEDGAVFPEELENRKGFLGRAACQHSAQPESCLL